MAISGIYKNILFVVCLFEILASTAATAQKIPDISDLARWVVPYPQAHQLEFMESSIGLTVPQWDGGRSEIEFADLNLDGNLDIVTIGDHGSPYINTDMHGVSVWFGDGTGRWLTHQEGYFGYGGIDVGDVNNDGFPDVGYGMHHNYSNTDFGDQLMEVALGDGTGTLWTPWDDNLGLHGQSWGMFSTEFADIDCDGWLDLGSVSFGSGNGIHVYRNNHDGIWEWYFAASGGNSNMELTSGDVNNDGYPDFAAAIQNGTIWMNNQKDGFYLADTNLPPSGAMGRAGTDLGDVNGDGYDDLSFVNTNGGLEVWIWDNPNQQWQDFSGTLPDSGNASATQLVDMNIDGKLDLVAFGNARLVVFLGDNEGNWKFENTFNVDNPGNYAALRIADADHNGYPDLGIVSEKKVGGIFSYRNQLQFFKETSIPKTLWINIIKPSRQHILRQGSVLFIEWVAAVPTQYENISVTLEISLDGANGPWLPVADNLLNNGKYQLNINTPRDSNNCFIKAIINADQNTSIDIHGPLTIVAK